MESAGNNLGGLEGQVQALEEGRAFVDLSSWWMTEVSGVGAAAWLDDLLTADLSRLEPDRSRRSLLLSATGKLRAEVHVLRHASSLLLVQDPRQPDTVTDLLAPYVLSSSVRLTHVTGAIAIFAAPGPDDRRRAPLRGGRWSRPSVLAGGADLLVPAERREDAERELSATSMPTAGDAVEILRIRRGIARFPVDLGVDPLPAEAGLDEVAIDFAKGCFLGQEAARMTRDRGRTPFASAAFTAEAPVLAGEPVISKARRVGYVTSAAPMRGGVETALIARVRRGALGDQLASASGLRLTP